MHGGRVLEDPGDLTNGCPESHPQILRQQNLVSGTHVGADRIFRPCGQGGVKFIVRISENYTLCHANLNTTTRSYYRKESAASGIKSNLVPRLRKKPGNEVGSKVPPRDQRQHAQFAEYGAVYMILLILVPRALLMRGATRGSGQIHIRTGI